MNKNAIKKFAIEARKKLIASVSDRAGMLGITSEGCSEPITMGIDFEVYKTVAGTEVTLGRTQCEQRRKLKEQIEARGFEAVVEEVAYTWFNRICAIRFMEVNDYLPTRVRVLSSEKEGKNEPDIVTQAPDVDLDFTDKEREYIFDCKMNNKLDELFKMLFIKQCNKLSEILPELFEATEDYTEMLLNISYTNKDDIIYMLVNQETGIPEADFNVTTIGEDGQPTGQVEIIGWLYQYYNTELKDDTFAQLKKNVKISKERIPAATQLFTPDWIVRYMVENSVGRLWIEHLRAVDPSVNEKETAEKFGWKYYLPEAEQEANVNVKLAEIRTSYKDLKPEDITCIDPCMGSGHILVAMFDVLMDIYKSAGYSERDAAFEIVEHNIHGLDIDKRAYQLAYFAVMMKGRSYNRRFLRKIEETAINPHIYAINESKNVNKKHLDYMGENFSSEDKKECILQIQKILTTFYCAQELGSIIEVEQCDWMKLKKFVSEFSVNQYSLETIGIEETCLAIYKILEICSVLGKKYTAVVTNPPYMGTSNGGKALNDYVKAYYPISKSDMYSVFIERTEKMLSPIGYQAMITQQSWMFLSGFEKLREKMKCRDYINLLQLGARAFDEIGGEVVQTATFVRRNRLVGDYIGNYVKLTMGMSQTEKELMYLSGANKYSTKMKNFEGIPGSPIAFWVSENVFRVYKSGKPLRDYCDVKNGMSTTNNNRFVRHWAECELEKIGIGHANAIEALDSRKKWFPYNKGGEYRKWYGNTGLVVNWENDGAEIKKAAEGASGGRIVSQEYYFRQSVSWSKVSSGRFALRMYPKGFLFDVAGPGIYSDDRMQKYVMGVMNSVLNIVCLQELYPTMNYEMGQISSFPIIVDDEWMDEVVSLVEENIEIEKNDWDSYETSWDFKVHPLIPQNNESLIKICYEQWNDRCVQRVERLKNNEERINEIFVELYGFGEQLDTSVAYENLSISKPVLDRDVKSLLSYFVGLIMGRYCLEHCNIIHREIIPITEQTYFDEDIVSLIVDCVRQIYGEATLEENLEFIATAIGYKNASSREAIRKYFVEDFYKVHCANYSAGILGKKPIYWKLCSGKENAFSCLMYLHNYSEDTIGKIRIEYLHNTQKAIEQAKISAEYIRDNTSIGSEKAFATKQIEKYTKQLAEIKLYDEAVAHIANQRIRLNLDDGVKNNYEKFQGVEVSQEGKKAIKVDLLSKI